MLLGTQGGTEERACGVDGLVTGGTSQCRAGTQRCEGGVFGMCVGATGPTPEVCDPVDNDCDGMLNENPESDATCAVPNTTARCDLGRCVIVSCAPGFDDCDGDASNGCEIDLRTTATDCGACDHTCGAGQPCVSGVCDPPIAIAAGGVGTARTCVVRSTGAVVCWGSNTDRMMSDWLSPVTLSGVSDAIDVEVGGSRMVCALRASGDVFCWYEGTNPMPISGANRLGGGRNFHCARRTDGTSHCWGDNETAQLGSGFGTIEFSTDPLMLGVASVEGFALGGYHGCAITASGGVTCWGGNGEGEVGDGTLVTASPPVTAFGLTSVVSASAGEQHTCAVRADGRVYCWGIGGILGLGDSMRRTRPTEVTDAVGASAVACGDDFTCTIRSDGRVACWGAIPGAAAPAARPVLLDEPTGVVELAGGPDHACARTLDGRILCWGANAFGQLGNGTRIASATPVEVVLP